jgi:hypothetical protein
MSLPKMLSCETNVWMSNSCLVYDIHVSVFCQLRATCKSILMKIS